MSSTPAEVQQIKVPDRVWDNVLRGMAGVVDSRSGTASRYGLAQYGFAAKTGTAEMGGKLQTHAWIAGFAPRTTPEIAVVVMVEHAGHGGEVTGPIVARILDAYGKRR